ncbi:MAG TPA: VOC family protein [Candidatus Limnocylindrales bacterium]
MSERITPQRFFDVVGLEDWRIVGEGACAFYRTESLAASARLAQAIGELKEVDDDHTTVDLRGDGVTVRLVTIKPGHYGLSERDLELAQQISALARDLNFTADPSRIQNVQICIDALVNADVLPFWRAILGYTDRPDNPAEDLIDPRRRGPLVYFQGMDRPRPQRNRIHLDVWVAHDQADARIAAAVAAGGRVVTDEYAPSWTVLADAEGNEACVCTWQEHA